MSKFYIRLFTATLVALFGAQVLLTQQAQAVNPADFDAGRIIDDELFYKKDDMSVGDIQNFLNAHVPSCDTWGTQPSGYGNLSRAQYAQQIKGWPGPPYVCLNNYYENPDTGATSFENGGGAFSGGISAAQIIYSAAQQYSINPKVLMVLLRKEALNIYGDSWPLKSQYKYAMGYACPDSGPGYSAACDASKSGFYKQMMLAAWQLRYYYDHMGTYNYAPGRWNTIQYDVEPSCGTKEVYIQNYATASLYIYTPYTPTQAALNAYPGSAEPCGAYGNRNFWFMWQEWFGSTYAAANQVSSLTLLSSVPGAGLFANDFVEASFIIKNNANFVNDIGVVAVACRNSQGANCDFPGQHVVLQPGQSYLYRTAINLANEGKYTFWITNYRDGQWNDNLPSPSGNEVRRYDNLLVQNKPTLTLNPSATGDIRVGSTQNISFTMRNNSAYPIDMGNLAVGMVSPSGRNADLSPVRAPVIPANSYYTYTKPFTPSETGNYKATVLQTPDFNTWNNGNYPIPTSGASGKEVFVSKPNPTIIEGVTLDTATPRVGDPVNFTVKLKNFSTNNANAGYVGIAIRDPEGKNADIPVQALSQIAPNTEVAIQGQRTFTKSGSITATPVSYKDGTWNESLPVMEDSAAQRTKVFNIKPNVTVTQGITVDKPSTYIGDMVTGTFKVKNFSQVPAAIDKTLCYIARGPNNTNFDFGCLDIGTLGAGQEKTFTASRKASVAGVYNAYFSMYDGAWHDGWSLPRELGGEPLKATFTVKPNPTLTQGLTMTSNLQNGAMGTGSFKVRNNSTSSITVNKTVCYIIRNAAGKNFDLGCLEISTLNSGQEVTFTGSKSFPSGVYNAYFSMYDGTWHDGWSFNQQTGNEPVKMTFTVL